MRKVRRSALVPYAADSMFALVNDVAAYPDFLPWCRSAVVHVEREDFMEASLELVKGNMSKVFTTRNQLVPAESIEIGLVSGPFRHLQGVRVLRSDELNACEVSLDLEFEFENPLTGLLFGSMFEDIAISLVESFTKRARQVYGER